MTAPSGYKSGNARVVLIDNGTGGAVFDQTYSDPSQFPVSISLTNLTGSTGIIYVAYTDANTSESKNDQQNVTFEAE